MSGIAAIISFDGPAIEGGSIERMTSTMSFRGPDGLNHLRSGNYAFGHCTMHTTAESLESEQPLANEDKTQIVVLDGFISNWEELRAKLRSSGTSLRNRSDAELVLRAYQTWGDDCAIHIEGEYAFIIWDDIRKQAMCARDHAGLRPLHYHWQNKTLIVASDVAAVLAVTGTSKRLNHGALAEIMADEWLEGDATIWPAVKRLLPAHTLNVNGAGLQLSRYWSLPVEVDIYYSRDEDYFEHYRELFSECVRNYSRTHLPLACDVSGGLDSSANFCQAQKLLSEGRLLAPSIKGYTLVSETGGDADEIEFARSVSQLLRTKINEVPLYFPGIEAFSAEALNSCDFPPFPNLAMSDALGKALVADGCRVNMNGIGGDQSLSGTLYYYHELLKNSDWRNLSETLWNDCKLFGAFETSTNFARFGLYPYAPVALRNYLRRRHLDKALEDNKNFYWLNEEYKDYIIGKLYEECSERPADSLEYYKKKHLESPYWGILFSIVSRHFAQLGYEPRSPMLSRPFVEFCARIPQRLKVRGGLDKFIHRRALRGLIPDKIADRTSKAEFTVAYDRALNSLSKWFCGELVARPRGGIDPIGIEHLYASRLNRIDDGYGTMLSHRKSRELWGIFAAITLHDAFDLKSTF